MLKSLAIVAGGLVTALASICHAQDKCKDKVFVDTVYAHQTSAGRYEYILQLRNLTRKPVGWQIDFKNLLAGVNFYKAQMVSEAPLAPGASTSLRVGSGTNGTVNSNSASIGYDAPGSVITLSHCK